MTVYVATFLGAVGLASLASMHIDRENKRSTLPRSFSITAFLVGVLLATISALRWQVGTDYAQYVRNFPRYVSEATEGFTQEIGIRWLAWLTEKLNGDGVTMLALAAILTIGLTVRTLWRWSPAFSFAIAIFILSGTWHGTFNGVRQYIAGAILFAGHRYIIDRRPLMWLLTVLAASLFHISAILGILMYFIPRRRLQVRHQVMLLLLASVLLNLSDWFLGFMGNQSGELGQWTGDYGMRDVNPWRVAFAFMPVLLYWLLPNSAALQRNHGWFYVNMLLLHAAVWLATAGSAYLARFTIYPKIFLGISLAHLTSYPRAADRAFVRLLLIVVYSIFIYIDVSSSPDLRDFQWVFERP